MQSTDIFHIYNKFYCLCNGRVLSSRWHCYVFLHVLNCWQRRHLANCDKTPVLPGVSLATRQRCWTAAWWLHQCQMTIFHTRHQWCSGNMGTPPFFPPPLLSLSLPFLLFSILLPLEVGPFNPAGLWELCMERSPAGSGAEPQPQTYFRTFCALGTASDDINFCSLLLAPLARRSISISSERNAPYVTEHSPGPRNDLWQKWGGYVHPTESTSWPSPWSDGQIFALDGSNDADSRKDMPFGDSRIGWYCSPFWGSNYAKNPDFWSVNRRFQAKRVKNSNFRIF